MRPGVCLYGASPFADADAASFGLRPAQSLRSEIIAVQELKAGDSVGYGAIFRAERAMRIGVVACGYADGYPGTPPPARPSWWQACAPSWRAGVHGHADGRSGPGARRRRGLAGLALGEDGPSVDEVAQAAGTIGYELLCAVAPRVPVIREP